MQTVEDFQTAIEDKWDNESAAEACFMVAKQMAIDFADHIAQEGIRAGNSKDYFDDWNNKPA